MRIRTAWQQMVARWKADMPKAFRRVVYIGSTVSALALAVNTAMEMAHAMQPLWWSNIYPYIIGIPAGGAFIAKFTREHTNESYSDKDKTK